MYTKNLHKEIILIILRWAYGQDKNRLVKYSEEDPAINNYALNVAHVEDLEHCVGQYNDRTLCYFFGPLRNYKEFGDVLRVFGQQQRSGTDQ